MREDPRAGLRRLPLGFARSLALALALAGPSSRTASAQDLPYTLDEVLQLGASPVVPEGRVVALLKARCLAFRVDSRVLKRLKESGVRDAVVDAVRSACRILPGEPRRLKIEPDSLQLRPGERATLAARGIAADGSPLEHPEVRWSSADPEVALIDSRGRLTAQTPGRTRVTARATNDVRASAHVWVQTPPGPGPIRPRTALLVGALVPGAGQFYTAQPVKGLAVFGGVAAALSAGLAVRDDGDRPLLWPGILVGAGLWVYGALDGYRAASAQRHAALDPGSHERLLGAVWKTPVGTVNVHLLTLRD